MAACGQVFMPPPIRYPGLHQKAHGKLTGEAGGLRPIRVCNLEPAKLVESSLSAIGR